MENMVETDVKYNGTYKAGIESLPKVSGIYCLFQKKTTEGVPNVLYIGQSRNIHQRWNSHKLSILTETLDSLYIGIVEINSEVERKKYERYLINKYKPKYNKQYKNDNDNERNNSPKQKDQISKRIHTMLIYGRYLSSKAKTVYTAINFFGPTNNNISPSLKEIAGLANISIRYVQFALQELQYFGWLEKESGLDRRLKDDGYNTNSYKTKFPKKVDPITGRIEHDIDGNIILIESPTKEEAKEYKIQEREKRNKERARLVFPKNIERKPKPASGLPEEESETKRERKREIREMNKGYKNDHYY